MFRFWTAARSVGRWLWVAGWLSCVIAAAGQGVPVPGAPEVAAKEDTAREMALPTLHVYTNLIQIPVLVLSRMRSPVAPLAEGRFSVSLDSGPAFKPTHVRVEGDDPISLTILLDPSGVSGGLMRTVRQGLPRLALAELRPRDHLSVYVMGCALMRTALNLEVQHALVDQAMDRALKEAERLQERHGCGQKYGLWDSMGMAAVQISGLPGRRVVLVVSDGKDHASKMKWIDLRQYAQEKGIAIFGLSEAESGWAGMGRLGGSLSASSLSSLAAGAPAARDGREIDPFEALCELTGGMRIMTKEIDAGAELKRFPRLLRERYIVEFPRIATMTSGAHEIVVKVSKMEGYIRPAGVSVPLPDPKILADPMTLPRDVSKDPEIGTRRILTPKP